MSHFLLKKLAQNGAEPQATTREYAGLSRPSCTCKDQGLTVHNCSRGSRLICDCCPDD